MFHRHIPGLALLAAVAAACSDTSGTQTATVSLAMTDAPGDVDSVWVEIEEIYLQGEGGRTVLLSSADAEGLGLIELTHLAGTAVDLGDEVVIPAGNYGQLRFVIEGAVLETEDGEVFTFNATHPHGATSTGSLTCPSCTTSGIKVLLPGDVANLEQGAHLIMIDFDVSQSFGHPTGMTTGWVMHPVIRGAEVAFSGGVHGTVDVARDANQAPLVTIPPCPVGTPRDITSFVPVAVAQTLNDDLGGDLRVTTTVAADSTFAFPWLHPDGYALTYVSAVDFGPDTLVFVATAPGIVNVTSGADIEVAYTITSATCS
jgi:hypothetical protein